MKCRSRPVVSACLHPPLRVAGFTLIEVLLATALLAFGLGLAIAALRSTTHSVRLSEEEATRTETVRIVQQFLRRQLAAARPTVFSMDPDTLAIDRKSTRLNSSH